MKISAKLTHTVLLTALLTASLPVIAHARGEDAAINRNDPMSSTVMDRTNSRTDSWTSAPKWNSRKSNYDRNYDNNGNMVNSNQTNYNRNAVTNSRNYDSNRY